MSTVVFGIQQVRDDNDLDVDILLVASVGSVGECKNKDPEGFRKKIMAFSSVEERLVMPAGGLFESAKAY